MKTIQSIEVNINQVITGVFYFSQAETKIHHIYCTIVNRLFTGKATKLSSTVDKELYM